MHPLRPPLGRILSDSWINGAFPALYHDLTQYLFSALTVLAVSSLLGHDDSAGDRDGFEDAVQLLAQVKGSGNIPAREFYRHAELIAAAVDANLKRAKDVSGQGLEGTVMSGQMAARPAGPDVLAPTGPAQVVGSLGAREKGQSVLMGVGVETAETALAEPSLQELLMQPAIEMQFLEPTPDFLDWGSGLYWPEFSLHFQE